MKFSATLLALCALFSHSLAILFSRGNLTPTIARAKFLKGSQYVISPRKSKPLRPVPGVVIRPMRVDLGQEVLGLADVQYIAVNVRMMSGVTFPTHYHPRGAEMITVVRGKSRTHMQNEAGTPIKGTYRALESFIVPQGLIHNFTCISKTPCLYHIVLNSADAGAVFL